MAKDQTEKELPVAKSEPTGEYAALKAQVEQMLLQQAQQNQLILTLLSNKNEKPEEPKTRHEVLLEKAERAAENLRILNAQIEQGLADGDKQWFVSIPGEPMMQRKVGAKDEANAKSKFEKYHGILAIVDPSKGIVVSPFKREDATLLPTRVKDALNTEIPTVAK